MHAGDVEFDAVVRIDTPGEADYYRHGGIMQYVLRSLIHRGDHRVRTRRTGPHPCRGCGLFARYRQVSTGESCPSKRA